MIRYLLFLLFSVISFQSWGLAASSEVSHQYEYTYEAEIAENYGYDAPTNSSTTAESQSSKNQLSRSKFAYIFLDAFIVTKGTKTVDDLIKNSSNGRQRAGRQQFDRQGGFEQANKDFDALGLKDIKNIDTKFGRGRTGTLPDGRTVVVRPGSSGGSPTLEIQNGRNRIKVPFYRVVSIYE